MKWINKKQNNFNIYNAAFFLKKNKEKHHYQNLNDMIYSSWDVEQNILELVILGHFLTFTPLKVPKIKILKNEKIFWRYHLLHMCTKNHNIWCTLPEIWSKADRIYCHYGPFFALLLNPPHPNDPKNQKFKKMKKMLWDIILLYTNAYHKWRSYDIWFLKYKVEQTKIFVIFLSFQSLDNLQNQNFNIEKKTPGDIIILDISTINDSRMMYGFWDMERDREIFFFFLFWTVFCLFITLTTQKI